MIKRFILILCFFLFLSNTAGADIDVYFLDVGQGDSAIIVCDGEAMIIDGGPVNKSSYVYSYIKNTLQLERINLMVATHPHDDHIGGLSAVLNAVPVDLILSPVTESSSIPFSFLVKYADAQGTPIIVPFDGDVYQLGGATITILLCYPEAWEENDRSIDILRPESCFIECVLNGLNRSINYRRTDIKEIVKA
ncbi:MAG: MBL fold metallo-hydrolase [Clostridia bacterium]|nr:MBL fold metallo-hydrolase [Clostridia bacterium]